MSANPGQQDELTVRPLNPHVGVEVNGVDLSEPLDDATAETLRDLYARHHLLLFRGLDLSEAQQSRFAEYFGETSRRERNKVALQGEGNQYVSNTHPGGIFGKGDLDFHVDQLFFEHPLKALILYALAMPEQGGGTNFVNTLAVYDGLPAELKSRVDSLSCLHARAYDKKTTADWQVVDAEEDSPSWVHPLAWTDPRSGRRAIWLNKLTTLRVEGMAPEDSDALIAEVRGYLYDESKTYCHDWRAGDLILWDNLVLQHARTPFDPTVPRTLRRTAIL